MSDEDFMVAYVKIRTHKGCGGALVDTGRKTVCYRCGAQVSTT